MFKILRNSDALSQILLGALVLQVCVLTINGAPERPSTLSFNALINALGNRRLEVGSTLPQLSIVGTDGRVGFSPASSNESVLIFRESCGCQDVAVGNMIKAAQRSHQPVALINVISRDKPFVLDKTLLNLDQIFSYNRSSYVPLAPRNMELPYAIHVRANKIVALENS